MPLWPVIPTPRQRQKSGLLNRRARVIQICQKPGAQRNFLVDGLTAGSPGISIVERLIKNSVVRCATTLYALLVLELNATTRLVVRSEESPAPTACTCCWPSPVRVPSLGFSSPLTDQAREALRLGLLSPTQARHLTQLPRGNQNAAMQCASEHALTSRELSETVRLLQSASTSEQTQFVLEKPRQAIRQSQDSYVHQWDPRLSTAGNRAAKRLGFLLDAATKMNHWLRLTGRSELQACDRPVLLPSFVKLQNEASLLVEATTDFIKELQPSTGSRQKPEAMPGQPSSAKRSR